MRLRPRCSFSLPDTNGEFDIGAMERYSRSATEPKTVRWYDTGHHLNDPTALTDRVRWLGRELRM
jgi:hypothetical protein